MLELSLLDRLREFLSSRRFLWILTILVGALAVLYFLFVTFLFNPFEADLPDTAQIIPREVDWFFRWKGVGARFGAFPVPRIWSEVEGSSVYRTLSDSGDLDRLGVQWGVRQALDDLEGIASELPPGLSLKSDLLREVAVAGRGAPKLGPGFDGVIMLRVSLKVKAGVSLLDYGFVRSKLPESFALVPAGGGRYRLPQFPAFGGQDAWLMRMRDVVMLASREDWLDSARGLQVTSGEGSLALASIFHDNVTAHLAPGDQPVEVFGRLDKFLGGPMDWPGPGAGFVPQLTARILNPGMVTNLAGFWLPGRLFHGRLSGSLDTSQATDFQRRWYESRPLELKRLQDVGRWLPSQTFFLMAGSGDPSRVFQEMVGALDLETRRFYDEIIIEASEYQGMAHLLGEMGTVLSPGMFLAMRRNDFPPGVNDPEHDDTPAPLVMFIGALRDKSAEAGYQKYLDFFKSKAGALARGTVAPKLQEVTLTGGVRTTAFASPAIPGTGEVLIFKMDLGRKPVVFICNSYKFADEVVQVMFKEEGAGLKLSETPGFKRTVEEVQRTGANFLLYFEPSEARYYLDAEAESVARDDFRASMRSFYARERPAVEARERQRLFGGRTGSLQPGEILELTRAVDAALEALTADQRAREMPELTAAVRRRLLPLQWIDWISVVARFSRRTAEAAVSGALALD